MTNVYVNKPYSILFLNGIKPVLPSSFRHVACTRATCFDFRASVRYHVMSSRRSTSGPVLGVRAEIYHCVELGWHFSQNCCCYFYLLLLFCIIFKLLDNSTLASLPVDYYCYSAIFFDCRAKIYLPYRYAISIINQNIYQP